MTYEKVVAEGSVSEGTFNKNLKVNSHVFKWSEVKDLWQSICSNGLLFSHLSNSDNVELNGFGFNCTEHDILSCAKSYTSKE